MSAIEFEFADVFRVPFSFTLRPVPVAGDLRPVWKFASICMILRNCWGSSATLRQLHVLNWALRDGQNRAVFLSALDDAPPVLPIVRIEPSLNRAVDFALGEQLITRASNRISLAPRGAAFAEKIEQAADVFTEEKAFFGKIGRKVTATIIERVLQWNSLL
ncbi:MAG: hypothetical protein WKG01_29205 [Kofleriaceae bacterium]